MQWLTRQAKQPPLNTIRYRKCFAYLPTKVGDHWIWLESYDKKEWFGKWPCIGDQLRGLYNTYDIRWGTIDKLKR